MDSRKKNGLKDRSQQNLLEMYKEEIGLGNIKQPPPKGGGFLAVIIVQKDRTDC